MSSSAELFEGIYGKFDVESRDLIRAGKANASLYESGQPRLTLRKLTMKTLTTASAQLDAPHQLKTCLSLAADLTEAEEYSLALECYETALQKCDLIAEPALGTKNRVAVMHSISQCTVTELLKLKTGKLTPMMTSQLLVCLRQLRESIDSVFAQSNRIREDLAWQVLNSAKLIQEIAQPLIWYSCSKYIIETTLFALMAMDSIINLCTLRHLNFRMKVSTTTFYAALAQSYIEEASAVLAYTENRYDKDSVFLYLFSHLFSHQLLKVSPRLVR
jgi:hypothetical protein